MSTLCDRCSSRFNWLIVAWGRELTEVEKQYNERCIRENKAEMCVEHNRYFNKSFKKRTRSCEEGLDEFALDCVDETKESRK